MSKRTGSEPMPPSKRKKTNDEMPPPSFIPSQRPPIHPRTNPGSSATKPDTKFKLQTSIKDVKTHQHGYFSDDDEDDNDLWYKASQIEERELRAIQKSSSPDFIDISYTEFQLRDIRHQTSTQHIVMPSQDLLTSQKMRTLENKCAALQKQLKRSLPNIAKAQAQASQASCEANELKKKLKQLRMENDELRREKLNSADKISSEMTIAMKNENENLRTQVERLSRQIEEVGPHQLDLEKSPLDAQRLRSDLLYNARFDEHKMNQYERIRSTASAFKSLNFQLGDEHSIFHKHLISFQLEIADLMGSSESQDGALQAFKNLRLEKQNNIDDFGLFNKIAQIIFEICEDIKESGLRHMDEHFMRQEFAFKQTQYCSDQYFGDKGNKPRIDPVEDIFWLRDTKKSPLTNPNKLFDDEIRIDHRRLLGIISILAKNSTNLSQMMLTQNVSSKTGDYKTLIDVICDTIDPHILQSRFLYKNSGIALAFSDLLKNLSSHFQNLRENAIVAKNLEKFFHHLLMMSTNSPKILLNCSLFLINILRHKNGEKILKNLCKNLPSSSMEYSHMYKIYQIPKCSCSLQIFFLLATTAFRFMEGVDEHNLDLLFELALNLNALVYLIIVSECEMEFLRRIGEEKGDSKSHCKCYMFSVIAVIILNNQAMRHRNADSEKYFQKLEDCTKSAIISMVALLSYTGPTVDYRSFTFGYNAISEYYTWIKHGDVFIKEFNTYFPCNVMFLTQEIHEKFLEKLIVNTSCDFSHSFVTCESNPVDDDNDDEKQVNQDLWDELNDNFYADESLSMQASFSR